MVNWVEKLLQADLICSDAMDCQLVGYALPLEIHSPHICVTSKSGDHRTVTLIDYGESLGSKFVVEQAAVEIITESYDVHVETIVEWV